MILRNKSFEKELKKYNSLKQCFYKDENGDQFYHLLSYKLLKIYRNTMKGMFNEKVA